MLESWQRRELRYSEEWKTGKEGQKEETGRKEGRKKGGRERENVRKYQVSERHWYDDQVCLFQLLFQQHRV